MLGAIIGDIVGSRWEFNWIIGQTTSFEDAVRKAVALGADADTLGAIVDEPMDVKGQDAIKKYKMLSA